MENGQVIEKRYIFEIFYEWGHIETVFTYFYFIKYFIKWSKKR